MASKKVKHTNDGSVDLRMADNLVKAGVSEKDVSPLRKYAQEKKKGEVSLERQNEIFDDFFADRQMKWDRLKMLEDKYFLPTWATYKEIHIPELSLRNYMTFDGISWEYNPIGDLTNEQVKNVIESLMEPFLKGCDEIKMQQEWNEAQYIKYTLEKKTKEEKEFDEFIGLDK